MKNKVFEEVTKSTKMQERSILIAREVLVNGMTVSDTARKYKVSRQVVSSAKKRVLAHRDKIDQIPEDWVSVDISLPSSFADGVRWCYEKTRYDHAITITLPPPPPQLDRKAVELLMDLLKQQ